MEVAAAEHSTCEHGIPRGDSTIWKGRRNIVMEAEEWKVAVASSCDEP